MSVIYFDRLLQNQPDSAMYLVVDGSLTQCYTRQLDAEANQCLFMKTARGTVKRHLNVEKPEYVSEPSACI